MAKDHKVSTVSDDQLTADLAALGYPGFSHYKPSRLKNPADVLLSALKAENRDARLIEALPWLVLAFPDMQWDSLIKAARAHNLQNRLGFLTYLARQVAEFRNDREAVSKLTRWESELEQSTLAREDTLCKASMTNAEREWLQAERPDAAKKWNLLTNLSPRYLPYYDG